MTSIRERLERLSKRELVWAFCLLDAADRNEVSMKIDRCCPDRSCVCYRELLALDEADKANAENQLRAAAMSEKKAQAKRKVRNERKVRAQGTGHRGRREPKSSTNATCASRR
jgi:hypothetical protein